MIKDDDLTALISIAVTYNQAVTQLAVQPPQGKELNDPIFAKQCAALLWVLEN